MINLQRVIGFEWDDGNARTSVEKHTVGQAEAEQIFLNEPLLILSDQRHSKSETRLHALGRTDEGRLLHITFTFRQSDTYIRIISARDDLQQGLRILGFERRAVIAYRVLVDAVEVTKVASW